jgi:hypothetical protein
MTRHRVRLFKYYVHANDVVMKSERELFWLAAEKFQETEKYKWIDTNTVALQYQADDAVISWFKRIIFYADLTEEQFINYTLQFYKHGEEDWR